MIGTLLERMNRDPAMRAIIPDVAGANRFDGEWFAAMQRRLDVDFVMPTTRAIAAQVDLLPKDGTATAPVRVSWLPTAPGDPVAGDGAAARRRHGPDERQRRAADKLGLKPGDQVLASIESTRGGRVEPVALTLMVLSIIEPDRYDGLAAFVVAAGGAGLPGRLRRSGARLDRRRRSSSAAGLSAVSPLREDHR